MANTIKLIVFPVKDLDKAKTFYSTFLGVEPYVDGAYYVGYKVGDQEVGLDPNDQNVVSYIDVDDIERSLKELETAGATVHMDVKNFGGGLLVAQVKDADGNILGLRQQSKSRRWPQASAVSAPLDGGAVLRLAAKLPEVCSPLRAWGRLCAVNEIPAHLLVAELRRV